MAPSEWKEPKFAIPSSQHCLTEPHHQNGCAALWFSITQSLTQNTWFGIEALMVQAPAPQAFE